MQLQQLRYFVALADERHFTRAAANLHIAQPTLSQQIRALEDDVGTRLLIRSPGNIELTAAGEELLPIARRITAEAETARSALAELADVKRGRVRLGATPSLCTGLVPQVLADYHRAHPGVGIVMTEGGSRDLQARLTAGELDLALLIDSRTHEGVELDTTRLFVEELVVISSPDVPAPTRRPRIGIPQLRTKQLVMFREGYDLRETTLAACRAEGFEPTLAVEGGEMDAVLSLVAAGVGVALVPATVVGVGRFRVTPLAPPGLSRTVQLTRRAGVELSRAAAELESRFVRLANNAEPIGVPWTAAPQVRGPR